MTSEHETLPRCEVTVLCFPSPDTPSVAESHDNVNPLPLPLEHDVIGRRRQIGLFDRL